MNISIRTKAKIRMAHHTQSDIQFIILHTECSVKVTPCRSMFYHLVPFRKHSLRMYASLTSSDPIVSTALGRKTPWSVSAWNVQWRHRILEYSRSIQIKEQKTVQILIKYSKCIFDPSALVKGRRAATYSHSTEFGAERLAVTNIQLVRFGDTMKARTKRNYIFTNTTFSFFFFLCFLKENRKHIFSCFY